MKKIIAILIPLLLISSLAFAGASTCTKREYGYSCTGGTDSTLVLADTWVTSTAYVVGQRVTVTGVVYKCMKDHTSGTFATDLSAGDWKQVALATIWPSMIVFAPVAATTDTATFTSGSGNTAALFMNVSSPSIVFPANQDAGYQTFFTNLKVATTAASDVVYIFEYRDNFNSPYAD